MFLVKFVNAVSVIPSESLSCMHGDKCYNIIEKLESLTIIEKLKSLTRQAPKFGFCRFGSVVMSLRKSIVFIQHEGYNAMFYSGSYTSLCRFNLRSCFP